MAFANKIRLPFYVSRPQYTSDEEIYIRANGTRRVNNSIIFEEYEGETDDMPKQLHARLHVALRHENVFIDNWNFSGGFRINGSYEIAWPEFIDHPTGKAKFKGFNEDFDARNSKCEVCKTDDLIQLEDDRVSNVEQGTTIQVNAAANDIVNCAGVFDIASINNDVIESAIISAQGLVTLTLKAAIPTAGETLLATYSVTCGDITQTANIVANKITGEGAACGEATSVAVQQSTTAALPVEGVFSWLPAGDPPDAWAWELYQDGNILIGSGTVNALTVTVNGLAYSKPHKFKVSGVCDGVNGPPAELNFNTVAEPQTETEKPMTIQVTVDKSGGTVRMRAEIIDPAGVTLNTTIAVYGFVVKQYPYQNYNFGMTLAAGTSVAYSNPIDEDTAPTYTINSASNSADHLQGSDGETYDISVQHS